MTDADWQPAYIALGSNLGDPRAEVLTALTQLQAIPDTCAWRCSSLYRSAPMGPQDQPAYINAVTGLLTRLAPEALLGALHDIEQRRGRVRSQHWGPRIIDLDLLLCGHHQVQSTQLTLPHPGLLERNFVMVPLAEIAPALVLPNGRLAAQQAAQLGLHGLEQLP